MDTQNRIEPRSILSIIVLYFLGHFLLLLNRGFWSDGYHFITQIQEHNYSQLWSHLAQTRSYALYYVTRFLIALGGDPTLTIKLAGFFTWLIGGIALYIILRKIIRLNDRNSFFIATSFLLIANLPNLKGDFYLGFSLSSTVFFLAVLAYFRAQTFKRKVLRYAGQGAAAALFFFSFTTASLLVFYGGFLLLHLYKFYESKKGTGDPLPALLVSWCTSNFLFIILPIVYWGFRAYLGAPYGELGDRYNEFTLFKPGGLALAFDDTWSFIVYGFFWPLVAPVAILQRRIFTALLVLVLPITYFLTKKIFYPHQNRDIGVAHEKELMLTPYQYLFYGALWFVLGAFPYIAVDKYPTIFGDGFWMRYAILLPLGSSLLILGMILGTVKERWQPKMQVAILTLFIVFNIYNYYTLDMDWYRQEAIVANLKSTTSEAIQRASTLVFYDEYRDQKSLGRNIKTSEYTLYLHKALYPQDFKFGFAINDMNRGETVNEAILKSYARFVRIGVWQYPENFNPLAKVVDVAVVSKAGHETMTVATWLRLKKSELFSDEATFTKKLEDELHIEVVPIVPEKELAGTRAP